MDYRSKITYFEYEKTCEAERTDFLRYGFGVGVIKSLDAALTDLNDKDVLIVNLYALEELAQLKAKEIKKLQSKTIILLSCLSKCPIADTYGSHFPAMEKIYRNHNNTKISMQKLHQSLNNKMSK